MPELRIFDYAAVIAGRQAVEEYRAVRKWQHDNLSGIAVSDNKAAFEDMMNTLGGLGFASISDFFKVNREACIAEVERCYRLIGGCDGCAGRDRGCLNVCFAERAEDNRITGSAADFFHWCHFPGHTPPGCGYTFEQVAEPGFDIFWGMDVISPEVYLRVKDSEG